MRKKNETKDPPILRQFYFTKHSFNSKYINKIYFFNYCKCNKKYIPIYIYIYI